jgi:hypothetical protein
MKPLQGVSFERDVSFRNIGISAPNNFDCLRARHDRGAPAVPLAKKLAERDSFASRDSYVFLGFECIGLSTSKTNERTKSCCNGTLRVTFAP